MSQQLRDKKPAAQFSWKRLSITIAIIFACAGIFAILVPPKPVSPIVLLGDVSFFMHQYRMAERFYRKALARNPDDQFALMAMGELHHDRNEYPEAYEFLRHAYELDPEFYSGEWENNLLLDTLMRQDRYEDVLGWCDILLDDHPDNKDVASVVARYRKRAERIR